MASRKTENPPHAHPGNPLISTVFTSPESSSESGRRGDHRRAGSQPDTSHINLQSHGRIRPRQPPLIDTALESPSDGASRPVGRSCHDGLDRFTHVANNHVFRTAQSNQQTAHHVLTAFRTVCVAEHRFHSFNTQSKAAQSKPQPPFTKFPLLIRNPQPVVRTTHRCCCRIAPRHSGAPLTRGCSKTICTPPSAANSATKR
jgi:hypothetical protein